MKRFQEYLNRTTEAAPLATFRILFGTIMFISLVRFVSKGWVKTLYIEPKFFFSYYGFEWVKPVSDFTYLIFLICSLSCLLIAIGYRYRIAIILFFISFTYIELMDKTTYLNHYYFISTVAFILIFLPANAYYSVDARLKPELAFQKIPAWCIDSLKLMLGIVYFYAGLAKINSDWLFKAMPLQLWLKPQYDLPVFGFLLQKEWMPFIFSWFGMLYDLAIPFLLLYRKTRLIAFVLVVIFHSVTRILFPIGMFPFIMIGATLVFFDAKYHHKALEYLSIIFKINKKRFDNGKARFTKTLSGTAIRIRILICFFIVQLVFPLRYLLYPGELFWTEEGFRFSWRVMLMEKAGYAQFIVKDAVTGNSFYIDNSEFLTPFQEKQMAFQPDFILEFARFIHNYYQEKGMNDPIVSVESYVTLNGRPSRIFINPTVNLAKEKDSFLPKYWIIPFEDEIKGL
ncbi:HTTM domain-containing protein [Flavobacterium cerinum]|uniref:HTTM domain-containing protein n=1 Tax=Flavobacterium cerinum TaxID=2502784 RepID=A0ABY5IR41_9FLAO|nr:HTTM domain-containing protein [Flavobacterium cerinum]UUC45313.1 HTTM domain-containing protein [Flavobacterium cerinum]